jgi:DNA-directed RNA polymerase beta' subunit
MPASKRAAKGKELKEAMAAKKKKKDKGKKSADAAQDDNASADEADASADEAAPEGGGGGSEAAEADLKGFNVAALTATDKPVNLHPLLVEAHLTRVFALEKPLMTLLYGSRGPDGAISATPEVFLVRSLVVPPSRFRPPMEMDDALFEHPHNAALVQILTASARLYDAVKIA